MFRGKRSVPGRGFFGNEVACGDMAHSVWLNKLEGFEDSRGRQLRFEVFRGERLNSKPRNLEQKRESKFALDDSLNSN